MSFFIYYVYKIRHIVFETNKKYQDNVCWFNIYYFIEFNLSSVTFQTSFE